MSENLQSAKSTEDRYFQILDTAPDAMIVVARDERMVFVNAQTERLFKRGRSELLGSKLEVLIPARFRGPHGGHIARYFANPGTRSMGSGLELFGLRADGSEVAIEVSLSPVHAPDGVLVSAAIRDITDRKRAEAAASLSAQRLASAVDSMENAFALFDAGDRLVVCNSVYRRLLGDSATGPVVGRTYRELLDAWLVDLDFPNDVERARFRDERLARRSEDTATFDVRTKDGRSLRVTDRRTAEGVVVKTIWDLTEDVRRAQELREARAAAEAASAAKSEFLSSMSHELRTPLNAVLGFAQLLQRDKKEPLSARNKERVDHILKGGEHLLRLIDDILDLSRIEAGGVSISTEPVRVDDVLQEVLRTLGPMATRESIRVELDGASAVAAMVVADRTRLAQILMNLGSNAIKYNRPDGKVTFSVSVATPDLVRVTVMDTGMGIASEMQEKMFQPFQRAGQEMGPIEGTGIGLVITKRLAALMRGTVGFRSTPGEGSAFWVDLPSYVLETRPDAAAALKAADPTRLGGQGQRLVLYVEDNPANVIFMTDLLSAFDGIELVTAMNAEAGVELARTRHPDVIIMDINLPGMSGLDALRVLRGWPETKSIPVIALTAAASDRDKQRGQQAGFYEYLTKPVKVDELVTALEALVPSSP